MSKTYKLSNKNRDNNNFNRNNALFLSQVYNKNKNLVDSLSEFLNNIKKKYNLDDQTILKLLKEKDKFILIPISIFKNNLSPLEAVVKYLKEKINFNFHKIASLLERNDRTIWLTYSNAVKKKITLKITKEYYIPLSIFSNRKLSILENLSYYLKEKENLKLKRIAELTSKDPRTIGTCYRRALKKLGGDVK